MSNVKVVNALIEYDLGNEVYTEESPGILMDWNGKHLFIHFTEEVIYATLINDIKDGVLIELTSETIFELHIIRPEIVGKIDPHKIVDMKLHEILPYLLSLAAAE